MVTRENLAELGRFVRARREERGWTQEDLAKLAGLGTSYVSNIERAYVHPRRGPVIPSDGVLAGIAKAIGVSPERLHAYLGRSVETDPLSDKIKRLTDEQRSAVSTIVDAMVAGDLTRA